MIAGEVPMFVNCIDSNFKIDLTALEQAITPKTKWLIINSSSNPTGAGYADDYLAKIGELLSKYPHVNIMSDDIYEHIIFNDFKFCNLAQVVPALKSRIFIVNGVSKSYSMTGWRIGYSAGLKDLIKALTIIQSQNTSNPFSISQVAAIKALNGPHDFIKENALNFQKKRDLALSILNNSNYLSCYKPEGAF